MAMVGHASLQEASFPDEFEWTGHLSFWNWKTGEKKGERTNIPDKHQGLAFLREDILLHGHSLDLCLDIYHIPAATSQADNSEICVVEQLGLPRVKKEFSDTLLYNIDVSFPDNPTSVTSKTDSLSSILVIDLMIEDRYQRPTYFAFITHRHTLLNRADVAMVALSRLSKETKTGIIPYQKVAWDEWVPNTTRMFWRNKRYSTARFASCGTRYFVQKDNEIEVYDFGQAGAQDDQVQEKHVIGQNDSKQEPSDHRRFADQGDDPSCQGDCLQDGIRTKLPFACEIFGSTDDGIEMADWEEIYVDQSRIVGLRVSESGLSSSDNV